ncbi:MAG TPA: GH25 family lysozyme [Actinocrinis sp.]|nr:GH25 family lysozyme [Actinocrinis sp.]
MRSIGRSRPTHAASRRTNAALTATALLGALLTVGFCGAGSASAAAIAAGGGGGGANVGSSGGVSWATTVTGRRVPVSPTNYPTPINPEKITHPVADFMGSTIPSHEAVSTDSRAVNPGPVNPGSVNPVPATTAPQLPGIDVSAYQGNVNWASVAPNIDFVYIKATEGTYYTNAYFAQQYNGSYNSGLIRGSYHFAIPDNSSGSAQADYFIGHGGGWSADGKTLPGALDIEYNPYGAECFGLSQSAMVNWVWNFVNEYAAREHAYPPIYTTTDWWTTCTGNYSGFAAYDPLWVANFSASGGGPRPAGWGYYTFWQYASSGSLPGDQDVFNGAYSRLQALATNG